MPRTLHHPGPVKVSIHAVVAIVQPAVIRIVLGLVVILIAQVADNVGTLVLALGYTNVAIGMITPMMDTVFAPMLLGHFVDEIYAIDKSSSSSRGHSHSILLAFPSNKRVEQATSA